MEQRGAKAIPVPLDIANVKQLESAAERINRELGPIAIWVNKVIPGTLDHYLAGERAWKGQTTDQSVSPDRPNNVDAMGSRVWPDRHRLNPATDE